jgi:hypothetical protein
VPNPLYPSFVGDTARLDQAFSHIVEALRTQNAHFLFGAGMSESSKVPISTNLTKKLLEGFFPSFGENPPNDNQLEEISKDYPLECVAWAVERMPGMGRPDLTTRLKSIFIESELEPSSAHDDFESVCLWGGTPRFYIIFTTNFDMLLEKKLGDRLAATITEENDKDIKKHNYKGKICVIHLHGTLEGNYKVTEEDLYNKKYSVLNSEFQSALTNSDAFVFVGYSLNDPDFKNVYMDFRNEIQGRKRLERHTYVVSPAKNFYHYEIGKAIWDARGAVWIPLKADAFFARLKSIIESQLREDVFKNAMKKHNYRDEEAFRVFVTKIADLFRIDFDEAVVLLNEISKPSGGGA